MADLPYVESQDSDDWDTLVLGSAIWPGIPTITGPCKRDITAKKAKGNDGATITDNGYQLADLTITLRIGSRDEWKDLQAKLPTIHPRRKGGARAPLAIEHPATMLLGITQVYIYEIDLPTVSKSPQDRGVITLTMRAKEWLEQPKPVSSGAQAGAVRLSGSDQKAAQEILDRQRQEWEEQNAAVTSAQSINDLAEMDDPGNSNNVDAENLGL